MEQPRDHNKAAAWPIESLGEQHDADFDLQEEPTEQNGGFSSSPEKTYEQQLQEKVGPRQFDFYKVTSFLIDQPNFTFTHPNAGGILPKIFNFSYNHWQDIGIKLRNKYKFIELAKDSHSRTRSKAVALKLDNLLDQAPNPRFPFITDEMLEHLKERLCDEDIELKDETKTKYSNQLEEILSQRNEQPKTSEEIEEAKRLKKRAAHERWLGKQAAKKSLKLLTDNKPRDVKKPSESPKKTDSRYKKMVFDLLADGVEFRRVYKRKDFGELNSMDKLLHAIALSATFASNPEHQYQHAMSLINVGVEKEEQYDREALQKILDAAKNDGFINATEPILRPTREAVFRLKTLKHSSAPIDEDKPIDSLPSQEEATLEDSKEESDLSSKNSFITIDRLLPHSMAEEIRGADDEPNSTKWIYHESNEEPIAEAASLLFNMSSEALTKRIRILEKRVTYKQEETIIIPSLTCDSLKRG